MIEYQVVGDACVLRLNAPPLNTISLALLEELRACLCRAVADAKVTGVVVTGGPSHFSAGADIGIFKDLATREDAIRASRTFQDAFNELEDSAKPVAAAVAGRVMGSALELALACHFRVCEQEARLSMPEVTLGINPGAGGTQRLPRLIGPEAALRMMLTGAAMDAGSALGLGLVDAVCDGERLVEEAMGLLRSAWPRVRTRERGDKIKDPRTNESAFRSAEARLAGARPEIIAPFRIIEAVKVGLADSFEAGLCKEQEVFAECMATLPTQNKIYLFFATRETAKVPDLADAVPGEVRRVAVVGMGTMGAGIAQALLMAGIPVAAHDEDEAALRRGMDRIRGSFQRRVAEGKLAPERLEETMARISASTRWDEIAGADLVIEAVFEDVAVKRAVIAAVEKACSAEAIIATNTSTVSLDALAEGMRRPERLIGMHFFNPPHRMPLVEIVRREGTSKSVLATAMKFAKTIRKTPVFVRNREGFLVNRIFVPYFKEAFYLLEEGGDPRDIDAAMVEFGFPMGPLTLIDMAGIDILAHVDRLMSRAFPSHGALSPVAVRLVERGRLGQKTGEGVYKYEKGDHTPRPSRATEEILAEAQREKGLAPRRIGRDEITERLALRMVSEAFCALEEGIVLRASDMDAAMALGTGFPDFRGGPLKYARDLGLGRVAARLNQLAERHGPRFAPCRSLREAAEEERQASAAP